MLPEQYYLNRKELLSANLHSLLRKKNQLGWARFIVMLGIFIAGYFFISYWIDIYCGSHFTNCHFCKVNLCRYR